MSNNSSWSSFETLHRKTRTIPNAPSSLFSLPHSFSHNTSEYKFRIDFFPAYNFHIYLSFPILCHNSWQYSLHSCTSYSGLHREWKKNRSFHTWRREKNYWNLAIENSVARKSEPRPMYVYRSTKLSNAEQRVRCDAFTKMMSKWDEKRMNREREKKTRSNTSEKRIKVKSKKIFAFMNISYS